MHGYSHETDSHFRPAHFAALRALFNLDFRLSSSFRNPALTLKSNQFAIRRASRKRGFFTARVFTEMR
eukprot:CCRYP_019749-RC/>CCRYP_019749-RC protein AED:0.47 eAED:1.00 QI:0/0/0/1/0/0/2/0/67